MPRRRPASPEELPVPDNGSLEDKSCPLCGRLLAVPFNRHHLLPLSRGGKGTPTVLLHKVCHDKIHSVLTETELKRHYHTIEALQQHEEIARFLDWVRNRPPEFYDRSAGQVRKSRRRR